MSAFTSMTGDGYQQRQEKDAMPSQDHTEAKKPPRNDDWLEHDAVSLWCCRIGYGLLLATIIFGIVWAVSVWQLMHSAVRR
jgi:hypothetical protein